MNVHILPSARDRDAQANLEAFIAAGKKSSAFGQIDWEADFWDNLIVKHTRGTEGRRVSRKFYFLTGTGATRGAEKGEPMRKPFIDFVKAAIRLHDDESPKMWSRHCSTIAACRELHKALSEVDYDPCRVLPKHFSTAINAMAARSTPEGAHQAGLNLARVAGWIDKYGIGRVRLGWKSPVKAARNDNRISDEAAARRAEKMLSPAALDALPKLSALVTEPMDILRMRAVELLACGGWRINELLEIPADCEVFEGNEGAGQRYGIRYLGSKGFGGTIKWIPTPMIDVAKRAVADIRRLTQDVRDDAMWIQMHPGRHPLFDGFGADHLIPGEELRVLLNFSSSETLRQWLRMVGVSFQYELVSGLRRGILVRARDVESALLKVALKDVDAGTVALHESLFLTRLNAVHPWKGQLSGSIERVTAKKIRDFISGGVDRTNIFQRFGFSEPDGSPIRINTHQFRHWLNTLAQEGGMSQELIARWSGRKDIQQNAAYDHVSGIKLAEKVRVMAEAGEVLGQITRVRDSLPLADRAEFMKTQVATAHSTEIGLCVHDWSLVPCALHGDCAGCVEHIVEKGNERQKAETQRQLDEVQRLLDFAQAEDAEGTYGAARWFEAHRRRRDSLLAVMAVHNDDTVPDGTLVHLGGRQQT